VRCAICDTCFQEQMLAAVLGIDWLTIDDDTINERKSENANQGTQIESSTVLEYVETK
jgi:hypothetical protein